MNQDLEDEEDQALAAHTRKGKKIPSAKIGGRRFPEKRKDLSHIRCFNCDKKGHYAKDCTLKSSSSHKSKYKGKIKNKGKRKHHDHVRRGNIFHISDASSVTRKVTMQKTVLRNQVAVTKASIRVKSKAKVRGSIMIMQQMTMNIKGRDLG